MRVARGICAALLGLLVCAAGCKYVSAFTYFFGPPQVQKAEYKLTDGRLAVLLEPAHPEENNPVFTQALCEKLAEIFREHNVKAQLVPQEDILRLRQQNPDFAKWSLQKTGQRLDAKQVLYARIERLQLREDPDAPIMQPLVRMRLKLIDPSAPADAARLWPPRDEREGREVERARPACELGDGMAQDIEAAKLGKDAAWLLAMPFYDVDLERKTPWEP
jgi:hypothetical protein